MVQEQKCRMELQYDGSGLYGWARQPGLPTVEGHLRKAFATALGAAPVLTVAGRTDTGVHARRQVVSLWLPAGTNLSQLQGSLNALTPRCITITGMRRARPEFDARSDAVSRSYQYNIVNSRAVSPFWAPYCWSVPGTLDLVAMRQAAALVVGRHDFTAFTPTATEHVFFHRVVTDCRWTKHREGRLTLHIEGQSFLRHMVRSLVGTMVEIGRGKGDLVEFARLLEGVSRDQAGRAAPAQGLFLWNIRY